MKRITTIIAAAIITAVLTLSGVGGVLAAPDKPKGKTPVATTPSTFGTLLGHNGSSLTTCKAGGQQLLIISGDITGYKDPSGQDHAGDKLLAVNAKTGAFVWGASAINDWVQTTYCHKGIVYAGGAFTNINGQARTRTAALNAATGQLTKWTVPTQGMVRSIHAVGNTVYIAGWKVEAVTTKGKGKKLWTASPDCGVRAVLRQGKFVYIGGFFDKVGSKKGHGLAKLRAKNGKPVASFKPNIAKNKKNCNQPTNTPKDHYSGANPLSLAWDKKNKRLVSCDGGIANRVRAVNPKTGANKWVRAIDGDGQICTVVTPERLFVGFHRSGSRVENYTNNHGSMAMFVNLKNGKQTIWQPTPDFAGGGPNRDGRNNGVIGAVKVGKKLYVTGAFTSVGDVEAHKLAVFAIQ